MDLLWVVLVIQAIVSGLLSRSIAKGKGHDAESWLMIGIFGRYVVKYCPKKRDSVRGSMCYITTGELSHNSVN